MSSNHLILCYPFLLPPSTIPSIRFFSSESFFTSGGQSIGISASASVLPMNIQDWFPLGWTGWISLQSKGLSRVFSNTAVRKHQFSSTQLSVEDNSYIHTWLLEKPKLWLLLAKWCVCFLICCLGWPYLFFKEQETFNFMAAVTTCSDFGAQENKICHCFICFPIYLPWSDGTRCHDLCFLNVEL